MLSDFGVPAQMAVLAPLVRSLYSTLDIEKGPKTPSGVYSRVVDGRTLYLNTTGEEKTVALYGTKHGIINDTLYEGVIRLKPYDETRSSNDIWAASTVDTLDTIYAERWDWTMPQRGPAGPSSWTVLLDIPARVNHTQNNYDLSFRERILSTVKTTKLFPLMALAIIFVLCPHVVVRV